MTATGPTVHVVVLTWERASDICACLDALANGTLRPQGVVVVSNGASRSMRASVAARFPNAAVINPGENVGCAGGRNIGIRAAMVREADYVWLLDDDALPAPNALAALLQCAERDTQIGIVGSKTLAGTEGDVIDHAGGFVDPQLGTAHHRGRGEIDAGQYDAECEVEYVTGCSLLARCSMIEQIGLLDQELFVYWEDVDWCLRAQSHAWRVVLAPESAVWHKGGTFRAPSPPQIYLDARNSLRVIERHRPRLLPRILAARLRHRILGPVWKRNFGMAAINLAALRDWVLRRGGPPSAFSAAHTAAD